MTLATITRTISPFAVQSLACNLFVKQIKKDNNRNHKSESNHHRVYVKVREEKINVNRPSIYQI